MDVVFCLLQLFFFTWIRAWFLFIYPGLKNLHLVPPSHQYMTNGLKRGLHIAWRFTCVAVLAAWMTTSATCVWVADRVHRQFLLYPCANIVIAGWWTDRDWLENFTLSLTHYCQHIPLIHVLSKMCAINTIPVVIVQNTTWQWHPVHLVYLGASSALKSLV